MIEKAYGKINLSLDVVSKRADGYHNLKSIMLPIDIYDEIEIELADKMQYQCNIDLPYDEGNIIYRCIAALQEKAKTKQNFKIRIKKHIPFQAGLAGGSSDGACAMRLVNKLLNLNYSFEELVSIGSKIGADIPFCLYNRPAIVEGIGEKITPIAFDKPYPVLLIKPDCGINTAESFKMLDLNKCCHPDIEKLHNRLIKSEDFADLLGNSLMYSASLLCPQVDEIISSVKALGYQNVLMTGSGSTVFVISTTADDLSALAAVMRKKYAFVCKTSLLSM
ncbi:MAG: 4-(cytidine 5'-diphospho)-2-C-methyl-D-erythritol kinase [Erysipelotrichaceae bacterium]